MTLQHRALQDALMKKGHDCVLETFEQLPSTSEYLAQLAHDNEGANARAHVVACDWQTQGNGRRGKSWETAAGNITFSVRVVAPLRPAQLMGISLVTGISVAEGLRKVCGLAVELKWPNDVIVNDRKLCGMLTELQSKQGLETTAIIAGIGINTIENAAVKQLGIGGVSLQEVCGSVPAREELIATVVSRLLNNYTCFYQQGWSGFNQQWADWDYLAGKTVTLHTEQNEQIVDVQGVDSNGALVVRDKVRGGASGTNDDSGSIRAVYSGEVSVRVNR